MTDQAKKFVNYTPVGTLNYPKLNKADVPTKFKGTATYQTEIILQKSDEGVEEFMEKLNTHVLSKLNDGDYSPVKDLGDSYSIKAKRREEFGQPMFFEPTGDRSAKKLDKIPGLVWTGTKASISFTTYEYGGGVSFALIGVCIHELVEPEKQEKREPTTKAKTEAVDSPFGQ